MYKITTEYKSKKVELFKSSKEKATELFKHVCELNSIDYHEDTTPEEW
jgi:hypothetical protein